MDIKASIDLLKEILAMLDKIYHALMSAEKE